LDCGEEPTLEKETFSIFGNEQMAHFVRKSSCKTLVLFGIESHVCVFQSAVHALKLGYETIVLADSCSSRDILCHNLAIHALSKKGATILPTETFIFGAMLGCKDAHFKAISAIVK
ncbi:MAG: cysteine hydrolase, partial [Helicobacter sp.]|nr:cysteine hydrolase [Helicobacter sp.]